MAKNEMSSRSISHSSIMWFFLIGKNNYCISLPSGNKESYQPLYCCRGIRSIMPLLSFDFARLAIISVHYKEAGEQVVCGDG